MSWPHLYIKLRTSSQFSVEFLQPSERYPSCPYLLAVTLLQGQIVSNYHWFKSNQLETPQDYRGRSFLFQQGMCHCLALMQENHSTLFCGYNGIYSCSACQVLQVGRCCCEDRRMKGPSKHHSTSLHILLAGISLVFLICGLPNWIRNQPNLHLKFNKICTGCGKDFVHIRNNF